jgi:hypothetical protein
MLEVVTKKVLGKRTNHHEYICEGYGHGNPRIKGRIFSERKEDIEGVQW